MDESARKITVNDSRINIVFKSQDLLEITSEQAEDMALISNHYESAADIFRDMREMIGLEKVKDLIYEIYALIQVKKFRDEQGLKSSKQVYHMIFKGNPGTGKTTVARIISKMLNRMGVLSKGHLVEVERADLVGEYIGHTALKTRELVKKAMGGILFIDEAYSLARGGEKDFGKEAIDCLVKVMEDKSEDLIIILAGYPNEMGDFLEINTGLPSRFPIQISFDDYSTDELMLIAMKMATEKDYNITSDAMIKLKELIQYEKDIRNHFSNARYVRNVIEKAIRHQAVRLMGRPGNISKQNLMDLLARDISSKTMEASLNNHIIFQ
ncbi:MULTISPECIES: AAA family ATPase [unclassified Paenibacillus]|uniref:AAA family ATPase n=1 Tax=Paenibacillus TaxID=44249 RepID=UPI002041E862|nr:AAA family ATPase [Paenibacillus sp. DCT19]MCM3171665.1 AAA family ATPase [Paenibacillus sp. MER 99-2]